MATRVPAKSILKQAPPASKPTLSDEERAKIERDRRNLGIALHHANRIQHQKDVQAQILSNIEILLDYPAGEDPTAAESSTFASLVQPFQPSDFDSLIEERRIDKKCGYPLCSNAPRAVSMGASAAWKLKGQGSEDYCSNDCLRKTLYVKSQLSEVPAWEREPGQQPKIVLADGEATSKSDSAAHRQDQSMSQDELALERGETASSFRPGQVMTSSVVEKPTAIRKSATFVKPSTSSHTAIEGYEPTMGFDQQQQFEAYHPDIDDISVDDANSQSGTRIGDSDEREAWQDLFDNIDKR